MTKLAQDMDVLDAIHKRRAVRFFTDQRVEEAQIRTLLDAAIHAPTAVHEEPWAFAVVQNRATLRRLSDSAKKFIPELAKHIHLPGDLNPHQFQLPENIFYNAGALIVIYGKPLGHFVVADCWLAAENLMLAACALGLGTCVIGLAVAALNTPEWKAELNIPAEMTAYAPIIVGHPGGETSPTGRRPPEVRIWRK